jgi:hypothetical protein
LLANDAGGIISVGSIAHHYYQAMSGGRFGYFAATNSFDIIEAVGGIVVLQLGGDSCRG